MQAHLENHIGDAECESENTKGGIVNTMELELKNKTVLVTGASRGIGFKLAQAFLDEGAVVVLNDILKKRTGSGSRTASRAGRAGIWILLRYIKRS